MGLLEKAEKIQSDEDDQVPSVEPPETVIDQEPEPVKKLRRNRRRLAVEETERRRRRRRRRRSALLR